MCVVFLFFKLKPAYELRISDWSSDVCSSDLTLAGDLEPATIGTSLLILVVEVGVMAGFGVGLSAIIARPLFSVAATYLLVAALAVGTLIAFGLGTATARVEITSYERHFDNGTYVCAPGEDPDDTGCVDDASLTRCSEWTEYT